MNDLPDYEPEHLALLQDEQLADELEAQERMYARCVRPLSELQQEEGGMDYIRFLRVERIKLAALRSESERRSTLAARVGGAA